ncbi:DUF2169 family type VI secretion system accessory protein [Massilia genomosp. 1]|uniref:DUF2169 domain-containing protein n=1 Tax=Massilia genomosp. 1 TaxID=2609280 RepID=A0ABX0N2S8_9BURK|nr:DUF2169 domain-containing protein [Massilia genomosp. 1]
MEIVVGSKHFSADISFIADTTGRDHLVVVIKSTWQIPAPGQRPRPLPPQAIEQADVFVGEPGESAMLYGADMARFKPRCDVLFNAHAYAPDGVPIRELIVAWQVGPLRKGLKVYGRRFWRKRLGLFSITAPESFLKMPLHFGMAFGGTRTYKKGWVKNSQLLTDCQLANPSGIGYFSSRVDGEVAGELAPSLEALDDPITRPNGKQVPIAFSAIARHWKPRPSFAGTYDQQWQNDVFPFLPYDFDEQFNQCAPSDQQMPHPTGNEQVVLRNMMPGRENVRFNLPRLDNMKVRILRSDYTVEEPTAVADTIYFEPDEGRFSVVWRTNVPVRRRVQEFITIAVGPISAQWWRDKSLGISDCTNCTPPGSASYHPGGNHE